jgi:hypothetical protein
MASGLRISMSAESVQSWIPTWSHVGAAGMMANFYADNADEGSYKLRLPVDKHMGTYV